MIKVFFLIVTVAFNVVAMQNSFQEEYQHRAGERFDYFLLRHPGLKAYVQFKVVRCEKKLCMRVDFLEDQKPESKVFDHKIRTLINGQTLLQRLNAQDFDASDLSSINLVEVTKDKATLRATYVEHEHCVETEAYRRKINGPGLIPIDETMKRMFKHIADNDAVFCGNIPAVLTGTRDLRECDRYARFMAQNFLDVKMDSSFSMMDW